MYTHREKDMWRHSHKVAIYKPGSGSGEDALINHADALILDFYPLEL